MDNENDENMIFGGSDKLNWGFVIQRKMAQCIDHEGHDDYPMFVKQLYDCVYTNFYGLDFRKPIDRFVNKLNAEYKHREKEFLASLYYRPESIDKTGLFDKVKFEIPTLEWYWHSLFECIRDLFAENRGLFFGNEDIRFSRQLKDDEQ